MPNAVTNRNFPMLERTLRDLFGIGLEYDPGLEWMSRRSIRSIIEAGISRDPKRRIRIIFVENTGDLSSGRFSDRDVIGFNTSWNRLIFVAVPPGLDPISPDCVYLPKSMDSYLLAVTLHELYENLTGDVHHCHNPGKCLNSVCRVYDTGHCCVCMGGLIDEKWPDLSLEDLYCEEDLLALRQALGMPGRPGGQGSIRRQD